jgi:phage terminase small subunit
MDVRNTDLGSLSDGPAMRACSELERKFVAAISFMTDCPTEAARKAGYSDKAEGCKVRGHELMHRERVLKAIEEVNRREFRILIAPAMRAARNLLLDKKHRDHGKAVGSMLSRLGFVERSSVDVNVTGEVVLSHAERAVEDLAYLKSLNFTREQLIDVFGFSGLDRYEKMLSEAKPKVIEHQPGKIEATAPESKQTEAV